MSYQRGLRTLGDVSVAEGSRPAELRSLESSSQKLLGAGSAQRLKRMHQGE